MADQLKEFVNQTFSSSDIANNNEYSLYTTNSTTQAVIKGIQVESSQGTPTLQVNGITVLSPLTTASGAEIVDVSSSVKAILSPTPSINATPTFVAELAVEALTAIYRFGSSTLNNNYDLNATGEAKKPALYSDYIDGQDGVSSTTVSTIPDVSARGHVYMSGDYLVNFCNYSVQATRLNVLHIPSGWTSGWTDVNSDAQSPKACDWDTGKVYWRDTSNNFKVYDPADNSTTTLVSGTLTAITEGNYMNAWIWNGVYYYHNKGTTNNTIYTINLSTYSEGSFTLTTPLQGTSDDCFIVFEHAGDGFIMQNTVNSTGKFVWRRAGGLGTDNWTYISTGGSCAFPVTNIYPRPKTSNGNLVFPRVTSTYFEEHTYDYTTNTITQVATHDATGVSSMETASTRFEIDASGFAVTDLNTDLTIRMTGVEVTGV